MGPGGLADVCELLLMLLMLDPAGPPDAPDDESIGSGTAFGWTGTLRTMVAYWLLG